MNLFFPFLAAAQPETNAFQQTAQESVSYLTKFKDLLVDKAQVLVVALIIFIVGWYVVKAVCRLIARALEKSSLDESVVSFLNSVIKILLRVLLVIMVITKLGVDMTSIIALITSASLAVGLAIQGSLANFAGGIMLLITKPFKVGDYIDDGNGHEGTVTAIEMIHTRIHTVDNRAIWIPNGKLADAPITNVTQEATRGIDFALAVRYETDIDKVRAILLETAGGCSYVHQDPAPSVFVDSLADGAVNIVLRLTCGTGDYWPCKNDMQEKIKKALDQNRIELPYQHIEVNIPFSGIYAHEQQMT